MLYTAFVVTAICLIMSIVHGLFAAGLDGTAGERHTTRSQQWMVIAGTALFWFIVVAYFS